MDRRSCAGFANVLDITILVRIKPSCVIYSFIVLIDFIAVEQLSNKALFNSALRYYIFLENRLQWEPSINICYLKHELRYIVDSGLY